MVKVTILTAILSIGHALNPKTQGETPAFWRTGMLSSRTFFGELQADSR
jgi:hypothetical protein